MAVTERDPDPKVRKMSIIFFWACGHMNEMLLILKKIFLTWLFPDIFRYDSPKTCPTILYAVNLRLKTVSATGLGLLLAQFNLYVHKSGLKLDSFHLHMPWGITAIFSAKKTVRKHSIEGSVPYRPMRIKSVILIKWWCFVVDRDKRHATCFFNLVFLFYQYYDWYKWIIKGCSSSCHSSTLSDAGNIPILSYR